MKNKWPDFLFTLTIRFIVGSIFGLLASIPIIFFSGSGTRGRRSSFLVEWIQAENYVALALWFGGWTLIGGLIAACTTPRWQTPWHKYKKWNKDDDDIFTSE